MSEPSDIESRLLEAAEPFELVASDLQYKWGFEDGDQVWYWVTEAIGRKNVEEAIDALGVNPRGVCTLLVWAFLIPRIEEELEPITVGGVHNPVRTNSVDGQAVNKNEKDAIPLTPERVLVPVEAVLEVGRLTRKYTYSDIAVGDIAGAIVVAARHDGFGEEELVRALQSSSARLRKAAMQAAGELDLEVDRASRGGRGRSP